MICAPLAVDSLYFFSLLLGSLSEAAKSGEVAQGDDGLHCCATESQHDVPVLLEMPGELQAPIFIWNRYCVY